MRNEKYTVIKGNALIEGKKSFTLLEMKLLLSIIGQIKRSDKDFQRYRVNINHFQELIDMKGKAYTHIRNVARALKSKVIEIETDTGHLITSYVSDILTYKKEGYIDFFVSPKMKPYLLQLKREFTIYDIRNVINCKSVHSIRLYQLLKQYEKPGHRTVTLKDLKFMLGLDSDQYSRWANFKARVLETAKKELEKHSDIYFEYETKRLGRLIDTIIFTIKRQKQRRLFNQKPEPTLSDAIPAVEYHKSADETIQRIQDAGKEAVTMSEALAARV